MDGQFDDLQAAMADRYILERELGTGGMATVFLARDTRHNRKVAVKVLRPEIAGLIGADRFLKEIETTANLQHPNILPLFDSGRVEGTVFYVMPYLQGESLRHREQQLPVPDAIRIATDIQPLQPIEAPSARHHRAPWSAAGPGGEQLHRSSGVPLMPGETCEWEGGAKVGRVRSRHEPHRL